MDKALGASLPLAYCTQNIILLSLFFRMYHSTHRLRHCIIYSVVILSSVFGMSSGQRAPRDFCYEPKPINMHANQAAEHDNEQNAVWRIATQYWLHLKSATQDNQINIWLQRDLNESNLLVLRAMSGMQIMLRNNAFYLGLEYGSIEHEMTSSLSSVASATSCEDLSAY